MKKIFLLVILVIIASCGPHRMSCGPRGICKTPQVILKQEKNS